MGDPVVSERPRSRCIFVGNIPYDATEDQLIEIFQKVGPVTNFRLVFDRETGKPRGYGFCEYRDPETAQSAIRNLNNYELNGRTLRVDFAENEKATADVRDRDTAGRAGPSTAGTGASYASRPLDPRKPSGGPASAGGLPPTAAVPPPSAEAAISSALEAFGTQQLYEILAKMKAMATQNAEQVRQLLVANPQLAYALLQAQVLLGMVSPAALQSVVTATSAAVAATAAAPPAPAAAPAGVATVPMPPLAGMAAAPPAVATVPAGTPAPIPLPAGVPTIPGMPPSVVPAGMMPPGIPGMPIGMMAGMPAMPMGMMAGPPIPMAMAAAGVPIAPMGVQPLGPAATREQLLQQVLELTPAQIEVLPPAQKQQVLALQQQIKSQLAMAGGVPMR